MKVKIDKVSDNKNTYKSKLPLVGIAPIKPKEGFSFVVIGGDHGGITTSIVKIITKTRDGWILSTLNSTYEVTKMWG